MGEWKEKVQYFTLDAFHTFKTRITSQCSYLTCIFFFMSLVIGITTQGKQDFVQKILVGLSFHKHLTGYGQID